MNRLSAVKRAVRVSPRKTSMFAGPFCLSLFLATAASAQAPHWVGSWSVAPCGYAESETHHDQAQLKATTVREIVHLSIGGLAVRVRFSNQYGSAPLNLASVHVASVVKADAIDPASDKPVTVGGKSEFTIAPGAVVWSDAVGLDTTASSDIAVSFFVPERVVAPAIHYLASQTSYAASGDQTGATELRQPSKIAIRVILTGVDVATRTSPGAVVAIGSSTTDGAHSSMNANKRWTDDLFRRLQEADSVKPLAVLNSGISGNRVLHAGRGEWGPVWGEAAISRYQRDVLLQSGVRYVIAFEGGNDIRQPGSGAVPMEETVSPEQLIGGFQLMAKQAHDKHLKFFVGTITPFEHADANRAENPLWEKTRLVFNDWARRTQDVDGLVDFDASIRDPQHPARILPKFDSGDHLHPNDAGYQAMADSIDLGLFGVTPKS